MSFSYCSNCNTIGANSLHLMEVLFLMGDKVECNKCGHVFSAITNEDVSQTSRAGEQGCETGLVQSPDNAETRREP